VGTPPDWKSFDDPKAFLLTDEFASTIKALPAAEKAAAVERVNGSLQSNDVEIRRRAALTLYALGDKGGVPTLMADLATATGHDQNNVAVALRIIKDERAVPAWTKALKDKTPDIRGLAALALGELKVAKAYDDIVALTTDKEGLIPKEPKQGLNCFPNCPAFSACHALAALGDERAVPVLIEVLKDNDLRETARQALESLTKQKFGTDSEKWAEWWKNKR
jgi:HEAT repeat protein